MDIHAQLLKHQAHSVSLAAIREYRIVELTAEGEGVTPRTRFQAASISKMVFAFAVLRLAAEKRLPLDAGVNRYLGDRPLTRPDGTPAEVTVRQLLSHTAGTGVHGFDGYPAGAKLPSTAQIIAGEPPCNSPRVLQEHPPGAHWRYSGGGYMVLQKCVENITEMDFADFMEQYVLFPIGMENSSFRQDLTEGLAQGYAQGNAPLPGGHNWMPEQAAAGLWTTAEDIAKFGIHLQDILRGRTGLIPQRLAEEMVTPQHGDILEMEGARCRAGLGCFLKTIGGTPYFGHSGGNEGFESLVNFSVNGGNGSCIFVNGNNMSSLIQELQGTLLKARKNDDI